MTSGRISGGTDIGTGQKIFKGLQDVFLYLLTPHSSALASDPSDTDQKFHRSVDHVRQQLIELKQHHIDAYERDTTYNPDASNYFKFIPIFLTNLKLDKSYQVENPCYQVRFI